MQEEQLAHAYPPELPAVSVVAADIEPFTVDCRELRWWFARPEPGARSSWGLYERTRKDPRWLLTGVSLMRAVAPAVIHGARGMEMEVNEWSAGGWQRQAWLIYGALTDDHVRWLACIRRHAGQDHILETFLDAGFGADWGESDRRLGANSRFVQKAPGELVHTAAEPREAGVGFCRIGVGGREHECLRVIDLRGTPSEDGVLMEAFIDRRGRTILCRRYNGRLWAGNGAKRWDEELPANQVLVVDGVRYVLWYNCLTDAAFE